MLRFIIGIDSPFISGSAMERCLRASWDIADFDIIGLTKRQELLMGEVHQIQMHAMELAQEMYRTQEAADYYVGVSRGYSVRAQTVPPYRIRCLCSDFGVIINRLGTFVTSKCLNKEHLHARTSRDVLLHNDRETFEELNATLLEICREPMMA